MKYLKKFQTHSEYETFVNSSDFITPNVSWCVSQDEVHYTPYSGLIAKFMVTDTTNPTYILDSQAEGNVSGYVTSIEIDGVEMDTLSNEHTFSTTGQHTVKYTLANYTLLPDYIFYGCVNLTDIQIPHTVTQIGSSIGEVFEDCTGLTNIVIPSSVASLVGMNIFGGCTSLETITINSRTITSIPTDFALNCSSLTTITIPSSVTSIGSNAFEGCTALTTATIPNSVTRIGESAFAGCTALTTITIPSSVTKIDNYAFNRTGLTSVYCYATTPPVLEKDRAGGDVNPTYSNATHVFGSSGDSSINYPLYVPSESIDTYKNSVDTQPAEQYTSSWHFYADRIQPIP